MSRNTKADRIREDRAKLVARRAELEKEIGAIDAQIATIDGILTLFVRAKRPEPVAEVADG